MLLKKISFFGYLSGKLHMKFFSWLGTILAIAIIIAAITAPGDKKFENFVAKDKGGDTMSCKPIIGKSTSFKALVKICSFHSVSYCENNTAPVKLKIAGKKPLGKDSTGINFILPKITHSERYLGLFGRFWKL
jgi:hypothetical protein